MERIRTQILISAPAEVVWAVLTTISEYKDWNPLVTWGEGVPAPNAQLRLRVEQKGLATRLLHVSVLAFEPNREFRWVGRFLFRGLLDGEHAFVIERLDERNVNLVHTEKFTGLFVPFLAPILIPRLTKGFLALNQALKDRAEKFAVKSS